MAWVTPDGVACGIAPLGGGAAGTLGGGGAGGTRGGGGGVIGGRCGSVMVKLQFGWEMKSY